MVRKKQKNLNKSKARRRKAGGRKPSKKGKASKVKKLIRLAKLGKGKKRSKRR